MSILIWEGLIYIQGTNRLLYKSQEKYTLQLQNAYSFPVGTSIRS